MSSDHRPGWRTLEALLEQLRRQNAVETSPEQQEAARLPGDSDAQRDIERDKRRETKETPDERSLP
ncbi:MAG: hypothetical protein ACREHD_08150 [Pirellulales bacterium]